MHVDKSTSPDGMNPVFYQQYWGVVGKDVIDACLQIINNCSLVVGLNDMAIAFIPKKEKPKIVADLSPIALCSFLYQIVSKILANRLKFVLSSLISES